VRFEDEVCNASYSHNDVLMYDAGQISPHITIHSLPDNVLLDIFEFCLPDPADRARAWSKLVHVCQRWRHIVFASPCRLDLRLLCTNGTPVRKMLDIWPPLPIEIEYFSIDYQVEDDVIAALEHPNRVCSILLGGLSIPPERLVTVMQEPFPAMDFLSLQTEGTVPALPNTFLGGLAQQLRSLHLSCIPFPTLPQLLLSSNDLVHLHLFQIPHSGYILPKAMAMCISALTRLTNLSIEFISPGSHPDSNPRIWRPPPLTRAVLPALTNLDFHGVSEYLEDLMSRIDAPLLHAARITFFNQLVFGVQQLSRFIGQAPTLIPHETANIHIYPDCVVMTFSSMRRFNSFLTFQISCRGINGQVSSMAQICNQLSKLSIMSSIEDLFIYQFHGMFPSTLDETQWLELFHPFTAVRILNICTSQMIQSHIVSVLREVSGELAMQVLPALEKLSLPGYQASGLERHNLWPFIIARQCSDHPVSVRCRKRRECRKK
jgi:F-box-like